MSLKLPSFQSGRPLLEQVTADKLNQLVDAIRQCELSSGVGYDVNKGPGGATLTIRQQGHQYVQAGPTKALVGPANSGMSHTDASVVVNPGVESYNFQCKTPTGSYTTAFVHGVTFSNYLTFNTANNLGKNITLVAKRISVTFSFLSSDDLVRRVGPLSTYQGDVEKATMNNVTAHASQCAALASGDYVYQISLNAAGEWWSGDCNSSANGAGVVNPGTSLFKYVTTSGTGVYDCSGTKYLVSTSCTGGKIANKYYTFTSDGNASGSFREDTNFGEAAPTGNYSYKRTFDIGSLSPSSVKLRCKVRLGSGPTQSFLSVKINGANATYTNFEAQTSTYIPMEITDGFVAGQNEIEFVISNSSSLYRPSVSFEFLPTSATISAATGFASLTDAQKDLVGNGTPVQVNSVPTSSLHAYNGSGDKGVTASYTFLRNV